jgi:GNAT superfamily N-acetyltransferase
MSPQHLYLEAVPQARRHSGRDRTIDPVSMMSGALTMERIMATAVALVDPRRTDRTAYLALLHCANDPESLARLLDALIEKLRPHRCERLVGPVGLSPHLGRGLLQDAWNAMPPLHTPYAPPYLLELFERSMRPLARQLLYRVDVPQQPLEPAGSAQIIPLEPARLATDLLPLLAAACPATDFPPPDAEEAAFLMHWLRPWPLYGRLAHVGEEPVGFVLLQPDLAPLLKRFKGGRRWLRRLLLAWASRRGLQEGGLLFGGVLPAWRGQGIGHQLWQQALTIARDRGWQRLAIGPLPTRAPARAFLERQGASPTRSYLLYQRPM